MTHGGRHIAFGWVVDLIERIYDWPAWISAISAATTTGVVVITAVFAFRALRDARNTRHGQLITELLRQWYDPAVVESIRITPEFGPIGITELVQRLFGPEDEREADEGDWSKLAVWANLIEAMGVLVSENSMTNEAVYKMWGGGIMKAWANWEPAVVRLREIDRLPDTFQYFEEIALAMLDISRARARPGPTSSDSESPAEAGGQLGKDVQE